MAALLLAAVAPGAADVRIIDRFAGGSNGDSGPATGASMQPAGMAIDAAGNVYFADTMSHTVRRIDAATGIVNSVAGNGNAGDTGDGGLAVNASLRSPSDVAVDASGNLYITDRGNHKIKRVAAATGVIQTVAGTGAAGYSGDGGQATAAKLNNPTSVAVEANGTFFITDTTNERVRQVLPNGVIRTIAGNGLSGFAGDGGPASSARLARPWGVTLDSAGNIYFAELMNQRIRMVNRAAETIHTFAGNGQFTFCDNVAPLSACFRNPSYVAYEPVADVILVGDSGNQRIRRIPRTGGNVTTVAGDGFLGFYGDGGAAIQARFNGPSGVAAHTNFGIYVADEFNYRIRRLSTAATPIITTIAGNGNLPHGGDGGPALASKLKGPVALAADESGNLYIADGLNQRIRKVDAAGTITTFAGNGNSGFSGDGGQATQATITSPAGVAADRSGNVYISDTPNHRVRRVSPNGIITTIFGTGVATSAGDNGPAASATVVRPGGLSVYENSTGTQRYLYVVEPSSHKIRRVDLNTNIVIRFAGTGTMGSAGDGGLAVNAQLSIPLDVATDGDGNVYIADAGNNKVRRVSTAGVMTTLAGTGSAGYLGDGGEARSARLNVPDGVAADVLGNVFINDSSNLRVRVVTPDGIIRTAAGNGVRTNSIDGAGGNPVDDLGDGGDATAATVSQGTAVAVDIAGNLYIADNTPSHVKDTVRWIANISTLYGAPNNPPPPPLGGIAGQVRHAMTLAPIPGVGVKLAGLEILNHSTNSSGNYSASGLGLVNWLVEPWKQAGFASDAISPLDASYVLQYLVNARDLSPEQVLACDVTGDGNLSALDATRIMQRALGSSAPFPASQACGSDWLFFPNAAAAQNQTQLPPLLTGGTTCRKGGIQFSPLATSVQNQDFRAVVIGDCTGNWNGGSGGGATSALTRGRAGGGFDVMVGPERRNRTRVRVPISIGGQGGFNALEARIGYDPAVLRPIGVQSRGEGAQGALVHWRDDGRGNVSLALASGRKIAAPANSVVTVDFEILESGRQTAIRSAQARVDEADVRVRVGRRVTRR